MRINCFFIFFLIYLSSYAQLNPIGSWTDHLPYINGTSITTDGKIVYCATKSGLFTYNSEDNSIERYSKVNRLNDINLSQIAYSSRTQSLLIIYENNNIDILKNDKTINLPFLKSSSQGQKTINEIKLHEHYAFLSMGFGILVIDLLKEEISDTYKFGANGSAINVNSTEIHNDTIYAGTNAGIYVANLNSNLLDFNSWSRLSFKSNKKIHKLFKNNYLNVITAENNDSDSLFSLINNRFVANDGASGKKYITLSKGSRGSHIYYSQQETTFLDNTSTPENSYDYDNTNIVGGARTNNGRYFALNRFDPLLEFRSTDYKLILKTKPNGPLDKSFFDLEVSKNFVWGVNGRHDAAYSNRYNNALVYRYNKSSWENFAWYFTGSLFGLYDVVSININPLDENEVFFGSWAKGLIRFNNQLPFKSFTNENSSLNERAAFKGWVGVGESEFDKSGNLWVINSHTYRCLSVLKNDKSWTDFDFTSYLKSPETAVYDIMVDDNGYKWMVLERDNAIIVFDDNNTIDNTSDDRTILLTSEEGKGNVPGDRSLVIESDNNGVIWLGSSDGIAVHYNPANVFERNNRDFERVIIPGENNEILLERANITALAIDGANQKWVGTDDSGVLLLSEDGQETLLSFNTDNSPLFSNSITAIDIDDFTGEVYIATAEGLLSYRSTSTKGNEDFSEVKVFPNPVRETYTGPITIQGLIDNSTVKITDVNGTLINELVSKGGTATWDGNNFNGRRASTGVYLIYMSAENGFESLKTEVGKIMFIN